MEDRTVNKIDQIHKDVAEMKTLLKGNEFDKSDHGMIGEFEEFKKRVRRLERLVDRGAWLAIGLAIGAGYAITDIITKILSK